jgi:uncharacterized membrane protein
MTMSESLYLLTILLVLGTVLLVFGMRYVSAAIQAKARIAHDALYRDIAAQAAFAQSEMTTLMSSMELSLTDVRTRVTSVEKMLKDVG